jgi:2-dehydropantoate 2-reductase
MRIATMATGGIGGYLALKLSIAGFEVATIARDTHLAAIKENGLSLDGPNGYEKAYPWLATDNPSKVGAVDVIIFGVKCGALEPAAEACKPMLKEQTIVVPFLNGVETVERLQKILPQENIANGVAKISTTIKAPGVIQQTGDFRTFVFAECDNRPSTRIKALQEAITKAGAIAPETADIEKEMWSKFIMFSAMSGVTAAGRCTLGQVIETPYLTNLFQKIISETTATALAYGVNLSPSIEQDTWTRAKELPKAVRASTAVDLEKGLPLEVDWISGAVVRLAKAKGLEAPANETIHALLTPHKNGSKTLG